MKRPSTSVKHIFRKPAKFKLGDKVKSEYGSVYTIIKVIYAPERTLYKATSSHLTSIFDEFELSFDWGLEDTLYKRPIDPNNCPRCGTPWHTSGFGASCWKDCLKCKKRAEDL